MAHIGHPVLGDPVYGRPTRFEKKHPALFHGQCLHAGELTFTHPRTGEKVTVKAEPPKDFMRIVELLEIK
jgi:23S rRNA pseudouridine1911/1915/1917 synthase